ncbi:MAG: signal peptidase I [Clostridia bacterium]|nr:signal peptidase I [Clostridia bacterium]
MEKNKPKVQEQEGRFHKVLTIIGAVMCVILIPMLIVNCTLIVKSFINKDEVPDFGGILPLIVLTDSMYPDIKSGELIFCQKIDAEDVKEGDVISFFDPAGNGTSVVTHKVMSIEGEGAERSFITKGINNNTEDKTPVPAENLVGKYVDFRIPGAGNVALFMQTTTGLIVCVFLPLVLLVGYDIIRRRIYEKSKGEDMAALLAELEALKAANAQKPETAEDKPEPESAEE